MVLENAFIEAVVTYKKLQNTCLNRKEVVVFRPFFYKYIIVKKLLFFTKIYICKKAAFFTPTVNNNITTYHTNFIQDVNKLIYRKT